MAVEAEIRPESAPTSNGSRSMRCKAERALTTIPTVHWKPESAFPPPSASRPAFNALAHLVHVPVASLGPLGLGLEAQAEPSLS